MTIKDVTKVEARENTVAIMDTARLLAVVKNTDEKVQKLQDEIGMDKMFTLIANGCTEADLANALNVSEKEFAVILRHNKLLRDKFMEATSFRLADESTRTLMNFTDAVSLGKEEAAAASFHSGNIDRYHKLRETDTTKNKEIIINNVLSVSNENTPDIPEEFRDLFGDDDDIIDVEVADAGSNS